MNSATPDGPAWWFPIHIEGVIAKTVDVLRQVWTDACQRIF